ncbi:MAG: DUF799 family lipoprotein [Paludibacteraceae bacterium]|nr:DUF799 family lipoprotein [Paludibacteraceae bacterium]MBO7338421.1 DUF799 family lipoprotein [Paludibacteraceae bacterium]MBP5136092.1 DUF799 family lipoprotein [Paludibacteraceae bacterium]MBP5742026.1 DUF799 family lipoprotein [Paludibacteraceae bacterium]
MRNIVILGFALAMLLTSCDTQNLKRGTQYKMMYEEKPLSIVVMPPINQTNFVEAKDYFYTTMYKPLCEKGYYVYSPYMVMDMFQAESAYDSELFLEGDLTAFRNVLGADAAMFTIIKTWSKNAIGGGITVDIEYVLRSTKTGNTIYHREGRITLDTSVSSGTGGALGALVSVAATAINTAATDKIEAGRACNEFVLRDMPEGKYGVHFNMDQDFFADKPFVVGTVRAK